MRHAAPCLRFLSCRVSEPVERGNGVQNASLMASPVRVEKASSTRIEFDEDEHFSWPCASTERERGVGAVGAGDDAPRYDRARDGGAGGALDLGAVRAVLEADAPRVLCPQHGPTVAAVPWARHGAGHT